MPRIRDDGLSYSRCACGAMWFDGATLVEYARRYENRELDLDALVAEPAGDGVRVACPRCGTVQLVQARVDAIRVRSCRSCRGCLVQHENYFAARGPERSKSRGLTVMEMLNVLFNLWPR